MKVCFIFCICCLIAAAGCNNNGATGVQDDTANKPDVLDSLAQRISVAQDYQQQGDYNKATAIADSILKKYPGQLDALSLKAEVLKAQNKTGDALDVLEKAYALQPRDKELAYDLAYEYAEQNNKKALALTDTLIKYDKTETAARAWYIKATYFNNMGDETAALKNYNAAHVADYNFIDAYLDRGQLLFKQKKYDEALRAFAIGQKISPATAEFYFWVAKTQEATGNKTDAKNNYERAFALDKEMIEARQAADRLQ